MHAAGCRGQSSRFLKPTQASHCCLPPQPPFFLHPHAPSHHAIPPHTHVHQVPLHACAHRAADSLADFSWLRSMLGFPELRNPSPSSSGSSKTGGSLGTPVGESMMTCILAPMHGPVVGPALTQVREGAKTPGACGVEAEGGTTAVQKHSRRQAVAVRTSHLPWQLTPASACVPGQPARLSSAAAAHPPLLLWCRGRAGWPVC